MEPRAAAEDSFRSSSSSSTLFSEDSFHVGYYPPMSEYEEIPSLRWLPENFLSSKPNNPPPPPGRAAAAAVTTSELESSSSAYPELDLFHTHVADMLYTVVGEDNRPPVSLSILRRLLEAFLCIEGEFKAAMLVVLDRDPALVRRPPVGGFVADLLDHTVRLLDVCSAVGQTLDSLQFCQRYAEIAASALHPAPDAWAPPIEARFHRARRALSNLLAFLGSDQNHRPEGGGAAKEMAWLFGRSSSGSDQNWSAARQVEAMWASFPPPRGADATALAMAVYAMSAVVVLVLWILVLAFPCQGQGRHDPSAVATGMARSLAPPWKAPWAAPMVALQERIAEEWRRAPSPGLLGELQSLARCGRAVVEVDGGATGINLLEEEEQWEDVGRELAATCRDMEEHLEPLQRQVREVFKRLLSRVTVLGGVRSDGPEAIRAAKNIRYLNRISDNMKKRIRMQKLLIPYPIPNPIISDNSYRIRIRKHLFRTPTPTPTHLHP